MSGARHTEYWVDAQNRIEWVDDRWRAFAVENGAPDLADRVSGTVVWDYLADRETETLYHALFAKVRAGRTLRLPYRCDAPATVREFELELAPRPDGGIRCTTYVMGERDRPPASLIDAFAARSSEMLSMCSWCKRVALDDWIELEAAVQRLGLFAGAPVPKITHGVCPDCMARVLSSLE